MPLAPAIATQLSPPNTTFRDGYRVQVFSFLDTNTFGIGPMVAEFDNAKNIGYGDYLNSVPEMFFTIDQDDTKINLVRNYLGKGHVRVLRGDQVVFAGLFGLELQANAQDAVFYSYGYVSALFWLTTDWAQEWANVTVNKIVSDLWSGVRAHGNVNLGFINSGVIEAPVTASGGSTAIILPLYTAYYKRILFAFQELAAFSMSDTTNQVVFEITHDRAPMFNFYKNRGQDRPNLVLEWGGKYLKNFSFESTPIYHRNFIYAVGSDAHNSVLRRADQNNTKRLEYGLRMEPIFLSWVRDATELERVSKQRLAKAVNGGTNLALDIFPNTLPPPGARGAGYVLGDRAKVKITRGIVSINAYRLIFGHQTLALQDGGEYVRLLVQEPIGT